MTEQNKSKASPASSTQKTQESSPQIGDQVKQILEIIFLMFSWMILTTYYISESIFKKFYAPEPKSVKGEIVLITGTGHGIGKQLALQYADAGAVVVGWDISKENNDETMREINNKYKNRAHGYVCNVGNRDNVLQLAERVQKEVGDVSILVANAGIMPCHLFEEHSAEEIRRIIDINLMQLFWLLEAFLPNMKKKNYGHIVGICSMAGVAGFRNIVPYCASKFAVRGLLESLREELRARSNNNINITTIYPYMVNTGLCKNPRIKFQSFLSMLPPEEVAREVVMAQRTNEIELSLPRFLFSMVNSFRLFPHKSQMRAADFIDSGLDSDLTNKN